MDIPKKKITAEIFFTPAQVDDLFLRDKNVAVVDVLRASTTIITALSNGAREIIPVPSIESAVKISGSLFGDVTLRGGERHAKMIEGFNLGNSPAEYTEETVKGKSIIFCTTNGSLAITKGRYAKNLVVAGFVNISKVAEFLASLGEDFFILCAGNQNNFCIEDVVCAGMILSKTEQILGQNFVIGDSGLAAMSLYKTYNRSILKMIRQSDHGKYLTELGFREDIKFCSGIDCIPVVPIFANNVLTLKRDDTKKTETEIKPKQKPSQKK